MTGHSLTEAPQHALGVGPRRGRTGEVCLREYTCLVTPALVDFALLYPSAGRRPNQALTAIAPKRYRRVQIIRKKLMHQRGLP